MKANQKEKRGYKKITAQFVYSIKKSRDRWKETAKEYRKRIRYFEVKVRDLKVSRDHWKAKALHYQSAFETQQQNSLKQNL